jgi:BirA family transcriptional regulator, biotin operon repressor / biotin---[acetyl-CoA-carboxylase] ligase
VLWRPESVPFAWIGSRAVVAGLALTDLTDQLEVEATLKWPNDLLAGPRRGKCAGILAEAVPQEGDGGSPAVVLGIGLNVLPVAADVPPGPGGLPATSLAECGARTTDRTEIASLLLAALGDREKAWREAAGDLERAGLLDDYRHRCETIGAEVTVTLPDRGELAGRAIDVDPAGQLLLDAGDGTRHTVFAGDVIHVRR